MSLSERVQNSFNSTKGNYLSNVVEALEKKSSLITFTVGLLAVGTPVALFIWNILGPETILKCCVCVVMVFSHNIGSRIVSVSEMQRNEWHDIKMLCVPIFSVAMVVAVMYYFREEKLYNVYKLTLPDVWDSGFWNMMWILNITELCTVNVRLAVTAVICLSLSDNETKVIHITFMYAMTDFICHVVAIPLWHHFFLERLWLSFAVCILIFYYLFKVVIFLGAVLILGPMLMAILCGTRDPVLPIHNV